MMWLQTRPQEAAFVLSLLHPDPSSRPTVDSIVHSQLLLALHKSIRSQKTAGSSLSSHACLFIQIYQWDLNYGRCNSAVQSCA